MSWWIWIVIIVVALVILAAYLGGEDEGSTSGEKINSSRGEKSAKDIADEVTTIAQFRALERKLERADEKRQEMQAYDSKSLKAEERAEEKYQNLQEAYDLASKKVLAWQFIPRLEINTPLAVAENAYKVFSVSKYDEKFIELGQKSDEWFEVRGDDEPDEKDEEAEFILKFRKIVENAELSETEKDKKINALVSRNKESAADYFDLDCDKSAAQQWRDEVA